MSYAIFRAEKLTTDRTFMKSAKHNLREYNNIPGVDYDREILIDGLDSYAAIHAAVDQQTKNISKIKTVRKDAVRGFELFFGSDIDFFRDVAKGEEYFRLAKEWTIKKFGAENYINFVIHMDEQGALHAHAMVTSIFNNKYNAKHWISNRQSLVALQDEWYDTVKHLGLKRGKSVKETGQFHMSKGEYAKALQKDLDTIAGMTELEKSAYAVEGLRTVRIKHKYLQKKKIKENEILQDLNEEIPYLERLEFPEPPELKM